ncbi:MAG TPA: hypothetical protein VNH44_10815, partial [Micropepsaceae bacterium]|nr:hypothetical protein [Micropepsaceae bacterium]
MTDEARKMPATEPPDELTPSLRYSHETEEATRRADDFPARMPRTETPSDATIRRIDETFRNLARRLENNERAQVEAQLAMNAAAAEINAATRDQAQAFKLLTSRIDRAERHTDTGALRDAVRGLHQGLSRLSDQIAKTTIESSGKVTALSGAVEQLAGKMLAARDESNLLFQAVDEKLAALDARVNRHEERFAETGERLDSAARLDETVSALERRMDSIEQRVQQSLGQYLGGIERGLEQISERLQRAEKQSRSEEALEETVRNLAARFEAIEASDKPAAPQPETENVEIEIIDTATADDSPIAAEAPAPDETLTFETFLPAPAPSAMDSPLFVG